MDATLHRLLEPASVAIVGTSPSGGRGARVHANILRAGFGGRLYAVNPRYTEVLGTPCFANLRALPEVPDCVVLAVPAEATLALAQECADLGVGGIVALASGFAEAGAVGSERQAQLKRIAEAGGLALCGPNGIGLWSVGARLAAFSPPLPGIPQQGDVALVSQSGGLLLEVLNPLLERGVGFSHMLSTGNEAATSLEDFVGYLLEQPDVRVVVTIVESFKKPWLLRDTLDRAAELRKPIIVLKVGRSVAGSRAAASHTGSLAQDDAIVDAVLRSGGATRVRTTEQLVETLVLFRRQQWPTRREVVLVSTSGGRCSLLGDVASNVALDLTALQPETVATLGALLPEFGTPNNPLDPTGVVFDREGIYAPVLTALANDPGVGLVGVYQVTRNINTRQGGEQRTHRSVGLAGEVVEAAHAGSTPIVAFTSTSGGLVDPQVVEVLERGGVPLLLGFESALAAISGAARYGEFLRRASEPAPAPMDVDVEWVRDALGRDGSLSEFDAKRLLAAYGIPHGAGGLATTLDEACALAKSIGFPVVLKASGVGLDHKTELGLVRLGLTTLGQVRDSFEQLRLAGDAVLVEQMAGAGIELIVGARRTEFGPIVLCGAGGVLTELIADTRLAVAPLSRAEASALINETRAGRLLSGFRGQPPRDATAATDALVRVAQLIVDLQDVVEEVEVNPLLVAEHGVVALDALVRGRSTTTGEHGYAKVG